MMNTIIVNLKQALEKADGGYEDPMRRYNGGWCKTVTRIDKSKDNGYSLVGEFIKKETVQSHQTPGLYLDCDLGGSRKNQTKYYTLFSLNPDGTVTVLHSLDVRSGRTSDWAIQMWPYADAYFDAQAAAAAVQAAREAEAEPVAAEQPAATIDQLTAVARAADALQRALAANPAARAAIYGVPELDEALCAVEQALTDAGYQGPAEGEGQADVN